MRREQIEQLWRDRSNWTWGVVYRCPQDPRVIVPRRWRWGGWTLNFAHPRAGLAGVAAVGLTVGPALFAHLILGQHPVVLPILLLSVVAVIAWAHWESSVPREWSTST